MATIDCLFEDKLIENAISLGQRGLRRLTEVKAKHPIVYEVRGLGLFFGMELRLDDQPACRAAEDILYHSLSDGLSCKIGGGGRGVFTLFLALTITETELFLAFDLIDHGLYAVENG